MGDIKSKANQTEPLKNRLFAMRYLWNVLVLRAYRPLILKL